MARPLRVEYPGACYHIINRGNQRLNVFHEASHYELFLDKLEDFSEQYLVSVRCYCLMPNHFHLYLMTREANLSRFMQSFLTSFSIMLNRLSGKSGHVFQGRFKSHLVDDEAYGMVLSRYIHLNPVQVKSVRSRPVPEKLRMLDDFKWSSGKYYLNRESPPSWIDAEHILSKFSKSEDDVPYRLYLEDGLRRGNDNPMDMLKCQSILGGRNFIEQVRRKYIIDLNIRSPKEQKNLLWLRSSFNFDEVAEIAAGLYGLKPEDVLRRRSKHSEARRFLIYCLWKFCRHSMSLSEMAGKTGISQSGFSRSKGRFEAMLEAAGKDSPLKSNLRRFKAALKSIAGV